MPATQSKFESFRQYLKKNFEPHSKSPEFRKRWWALRLFDLTVYVSMIVSIIVGFIEGSTVSCCKTFIALMICLIAVNTVYMSIDDHQVKVARKKGQH